METEFKLGDLVTYGYAAPRDCVVAGIILPEGTSYLLVEGDDPTATVYAWRDWIHQGTSDSRPMIRRR